MQWLGTLAISTALFAYAACGGSSDGSSGTGGAGNQAGTGGTGANAGTGGSSAGGSGGSATGGSSGAAGASCQGDATKWATITQGPFPCSKNSDCCVVFNSCVNQAQVVAKADFASAAQAWPYCQNMCTACITPAAEVVCSKGQCGLIPVDFPDATTAQTTSRCGDDTISLAGQPKPLLTCGG